MSEDQLFRSVADRVGDVVALLDAGGLITYANPALRELAGGDRAAPGAPLAGLVDPADRETFLSLVRDARSGSAAAPCEVRLTPGEGQSRLLRLRGYRSSCGDDVLLVGSDITKSRRVENEMHLLAMAVSSTKDAFALNDLNDNILFVNPAFCEMYGYQEEELLGRNVAMLRTAATPPA